MLPNGDFKFFETPADFTMDIQVKIFLAVKLGCIILFSHIRLQGIFMIKPN